MVEGKVTMFEMKEKVEFLVKPAIVGIRAKSNIAKIDIVKDRGLGIWFSTIEGDPDLIIYCDNEAQSIEEYKQFSRALQKTKMKIVREHVTNPIEKEK